MSPIVEIVVLKSRTESLKGSFKDLATSDPSRKDEFYKLPSENSA